MEKKAKSLLGIGILLILIILAVYYIKQNISTFDKISLVNPGLIAYLIPILLLGIFVTGLMNAQPLKALGIDLKKGEIFSLAVITRFYNLITPFRGGMAARAIYLKKKHNFTYTNFLATLAASYVLIFLISGVVGLFASYYIYKTTGHFSSILIGIFLGTALSMLSIIIFSPKIKPSKNNLINRFISVVNGWHLIKNNKKIIIYTSLFSLSQILISALMMQLQFGVFGINLSYTSALLISSIGGIGFVIAITPAGLGIQEAIIVFTALTIGISPVESLSAALLGRAINLAVLFILGPIFSYKLLKKK